MMSYRFCDEERHDIIKAKKKTKKNYSGKQAEILSRETAVSGTNICLNASCKLRKAGCTGFEGCPGYKGR